MKPQTSTREILTPISAFYKAAEQDARISTTHISLYFALLHQWVAGGCVNPFQIKRASIMQTARISSRYTFSQCMRLLHHSGYIKYIPSFNPEINSMVCLIPLHE